MIRSIVEGVLQHAGLKVTRIPAPLRPPDTSRLTPCGQFHTSDGRAIQIYEQYRNRIKGRWRLEWWPTQALNAVRDHPALTPASRALLRQLDEARTLPCSLVQLAACVHELVRIAGDVLVVTDRPCALTGYPIVVPRVPERTAKALAETYRAVAQHVLETYQATAEDSSSVDALEVGCGLGYTVAALTQLGARRSLGVDTEFDHRMVEEQPAVLKMMTARTPIVLRAAGERLPFGDGEFNLIHSASVLEHVESPAAVLAEMARVLAPGGVMIHTVDPYFSPSGGHSSCTLDFPWGHARLSEGDFDRYLQEFRPHERDYASTMYRSLFNRPRVSLHELEQAVASAGLEISRWVEHEATEHQGTAAVWREIAALYPTVGLRELSVREVEMVLRKR